MEFIYINCTDIKNNSMNCTTVYKEVYNIQNIFLIIIIIFSIFGITLNSIALNIFTKYSKKLNSKFLNFFKYYTISCLAVNLNDSIFLISWFYFNQVGYIKVNDQLRLFENYYMYLKRMFLYCFLKK